jgi:zinc protease
MTFTMKNSSFQKTLARLGIKRVDEAKGIVEYRLVANGLRILLVENHSAPVATAMVLYRVGSRDEAVGHTGATHFLEHMMFKGTRRHNPARGNGLDDLLKPIGALYNATTWFDRTNYFEVVPAEHLELCVKLEADRMRNLVLKQEDRDSEMTVVRNEFERGENDPDDIMQKDMYAMAFREHPYQIPTIGYRSDVENVPMARLRAFYDTFYWPNNATVILVGDFEPARALTFVARHFGKIPRSPRPIPQVYTVEPPQEGERRFEISRAGDLPRVMVGFHVPEASHADNYALQAAAAILGGHRRSSRLYKRLIDTQLATEAFAWHNEQRDPGLLMVGATVAPDVRPEDVEAAILDELSKLAAEPVTEQELSRAKSANRKSTILGAADPMVLARQIGEAEAVAGWRWYAEYDDKFDAVTPADVQRVSARYFTKRNRTVGHFVPAEELAESHGGNGQPAGSAAATTKTGKAPQKKVKTARPRKAARATVSAEPAVASRFAEQVKRAVLPNGMTVLLMRNPGTGSVSISGKIRAGGYFAPFEKTLVAGLASHMLTKGSARYSKDAIAEALEEMGTNLSFGADNFVVNLNTTVVSEDLPRMLAMVGDIVQNPLFQTEELSRSVNQYAGWIRQQMKETGAVAEARLLQSLYTPDCVYYDKPFEELLEELKVISPDDLRSFHQQQYSPRGTVLTVVGDMDPDKVLDDITSHFAGWVGADLKPIDIGPVSDARSPQTIEVFMPDKASVDIVIGHPVPVKRTDPDFFAARLANAALGQDTLSSRLGLVVREQHGLTYGIYSLYKDATFGGAPWLIKLTVNPQNVDRALALVRDVVTRYQKEGITAAELADEAGRAAGSFLVMLRTSAGIAQTLTQYEFLGLGPAAMDTFVREVRAVTRQQANDAIRKYLTLDKAVTVLAGTLKLKK